jgi:hypothetical protein
MRIHAVCRTLWLNELAAAISAREGAVNQKQRLMAVARVQRAQRALAEL